MIKKEFRYLRDVFCDNEYAEAPQSAVIVLTMKEMKEILVLQNEVRRLKVFAIEKFDNTPQWSSNPKDEEFQEDEESRIDYCLLKVEDESFKWKAGLKHSDTPVYTGSVYLSEVKENMKAWTINKDQLPNLLMTAEYETTKTVISKRLKG